MKHCSNFFLLGVCTIVAINSAFADPNQSDETFLKKIAVIYRRLKALEDYNFQVWISELFYDLFNCTWSDWSDCSTTCGPGLKSRAILREAMFGDKPCNGLSQTSCNLQDCPSPFPG